MPTWRPPPSPPTPCSSRTAGARRCARSGGCWPRRDPHGTWSSTQATVLALRALLEAAGQSELSEAQGTLRVVGARGVKEVHFAPGQADVVQRVDLTDWLDAAGTPCTSRATPRSATSSSPSKSTAWARCRSAALSGHLSTAHDRGSRSKTASSLKRGEKTSACRVAGRGETPVQRRDLGALLGSDARRALVVVRSGAGCAVTLARCSPELLASTMGGI